MTFINAVYFLVIMFDAGLIPVLIKSCVDFKLDQDLSLRHTFRRNTPQSYSYLMLRNLRAENLH